MGDARVGIGVHGIEFGLDAAFEAGLGEQRLRLVRIVGIALIGLVISGHCRRQWLICRDRTPVDDADDTFLVDRVVHRLAHLLVVEGRHLDVHGDIAGVQLAALYHVFRHGGIVLDLQELRRRHGITENIDLALLQTEQRHQRLLPDLELDLIELRQAFSVIVIIALEQNTLAERPVRHFEGARADRVAAEVLAMFFDSFFRHGKGEIDREHMKEGGVGPGKREFDCVRIDRLDAGKLGSVAGCNLVEACDHAEKALARALGLRPDHTLDRPLHVISGQFSAVMEFHALMELEGIGETVVRYLVAFGEVRNKFGRAGLVVHQPVEQRLDHRPVLPVVADRRIQGRYIILVGHDHRAALGEGRRCAEADTGDERHG